VDRDAVLNCVLDWRLTAAPNLDSRRLGGFVWGVDASRSSLRAALFHGGNLIPVGSDLDALSTLAEQLARGQRGCSSIVGAQAAVDTIWPVLRRSWGSPRAIRRRQPLLVTWRQSDVAADPLVRPVAPSELSRFMPASIAMFTEELGVSPIAHGSAAGYRARVAEVIASGRAFARFDESGAVIFKAEIGALGTRTAQLQGVWVRPDLRGAGIGTAAMAAVLGFALQRASSVSLYVNEYNEPARRMYERLGMRQVNTLSTVLF
jgi:hypothetical protein